jgi:hypothetical protein
VDADINRPGRSEQELLELRLDVEKAVIGLPDKLGGLQALLREKTVSEISRTLDTNRTMLYEPISELRARFAALGLKDYLQKT